MDNQSRPSSGHYEPANADVSRLLAVARATNRERDLDDEESGSASPGACPIDLQLRTVLSALCCALSVKDWEIVAEATAMLQDAELRARETHPALVRELKDAADDLERMYSEGIGSTTPIKKRAEKIRNVLASLDGIG